MGTEKKKKNVYLSNSKMEMEYPASPSCSKEVS